MPEPIQTLLPFEDQEAVAFQSLPVHSLFRALHRRPIIIVEIYSRKLELQPYIDAARQLSAVGVDAFSLADNAFAQPMPAPMVLSPFLQAKTGLEFIPHMTPRDRNALALHADLTGGHLCGVNAVLVISGDCISLTKLRNTSGKPISRTSDLRNSVELMKMIAELNQGRDLNGSRLKGQTDLLIGAACNPNANSMEEEFKRLNKKATAGASFAFSQIVYDADKIRQCYQASKQMNIPIFVGVAPLVSEGFAKFAEEQIVCKPFPESIRQRLAATGNDRVAYRQVGITIAQELSDVAIGCGAPGIYLVIAIEQVSAAIEVVAHIRQTTERWLAAFPKLRSKAADAVG